MHAWLPINIGDDNTQAVDYDFGQVEQSSGPMQSRCFFATVFRELLALRSTRATLRAS